MGCANAHSAPNGASEDAGSDRGAVVGDAGSDTCPDFEPYSIASNCDLLVDKPAHLRGIELLGADRQLTEDTSSASGVNATFVDASDQDTSCSLTITRLTAQGSAEIAAALESFAGNDERLSLIIRSPQVVSPYDSVYVDPRGVWLEANYDEALDRENSSDARSAYFVAADFTAYMGGPAESAHTQLGSTQVNLDFSDSPCRTIEYPREDFRPDSEYYAGTWSVTGEIETASWPLSSQSTLETSGTREHHLFHFHSLTSSPSLDAAIQNRSILIAWSNFEPLRERGNCDEARPCTLGICDGSSGLCTETCSANAGSVCPTGKTCEIPGDIAGLCVSDES